MLYETLPYIDKNFKVIFQKNYMLYNTKEVWSHWHESIEIIYIVDGNAVINCNGTEQIYSPGDLVIFNSNELHDIHYLEESVTYHYLIMDLSICDIGKMPLHSTNPNAIALYNMILDELTEKKENYREAVIGGVKLMQAILTREYFKNAAVQVSSRKHELVKSALDYMYQHFKEDITLDDISNALHLNRYYLCHIVKEVTGKTLLTYLNFIRCDHARSLLASGEYNITESAYASGFSNLAHFSQTYKKIFRHPASYDIKKLKESQ